MSKLQPPRGTQDFIPAQLAGPNDVISEDYAAHEARTAEIFERAGYRRIVTPMFEDAGLFQRTSGEGSDLVAKELYEFSDRSDHRLALRAEGTAPVMRAIVTDNLAEASVPVKLYYAAAMFRYDRPQAGRYRQHHQMGLEAVGSEDPALDAEVIEVGNDMLRAADVRARLLVNSVGHPGCRPAYTARLVAFLEAHESELDADCQRRMRTNPLRVFDCKVEADRAILADAPTITEGLCSECAAHMDAVTGYLTDAGIAFERDDRLVRGLDYYTRTAFEFVCDDLAAAQSTVCAGGRYDGLVEAIGGKPLPGIGFGSGTERILLARRATGVEPVAPRLTAFVIWVGDGTQQHAVRVTRSLRAAGHAADTAYVPRALKTQMKNVGKIGARYAVIIGEREAAQGVATVRDMSSGEQHEVAYDAIAGWIDLQEPAP